MTTYTFSGHESFPCRQYWLKKGYDFVAADLRFKRKGTVNDIHFSFVDHSLGSCGEISDWVEGRTWKLEVDDQINLLKKDEGTK